ncbi:uncharacterized protein LOC119683669 [Teleopsis dalmanni]|uniref:uncharacterized protein LOC119683669 n=1 Tax=Teleopsis dalmanni TaxID=139649 RepID=UPI0018CCB42F|nr:uncharacterized protein LOC119683669 [Teleopsis dalmanni]
MMASAIANAGLIPINESETFYQISDDDLEDFDDDCLLDEPENPHVFSNSRGPYERAWTNDATRALIHIRGPMEDRFTEGRQKRTALWLSCTRQLQRLGYRYSAAKVQKKWHNILITYNKNLSKKYACGFVHWEFFEDMFKYLQGKKADCDASFQLNSQSQIDSNSPQIKQSGTPTPLNQSYQSTTDQKPPRIQITNNIQGMYSPHESILHPHVQIDTKSNDEFDEDSTTMSELKQPKMEYKSENDNSNDLHMQPLNGFPNGNNFDFMNNSKFEQDTNSGWWMDYFERKLKQQSDMHREMMQFNKMALLQQEKIERIKIEAINNLTSTLQKLVETKMKKV